VFFPPKIAKLVNITFYDYKKLGFMVDIAWCKWGRDCIWSNSEWQTNSPMQSQEEHFLKWTNCPSQFDLSWCMIRTSYLIRLSKYIYYIYIYYEFIILHDLFKHISRNNDALRSI
jgi:hypothetical protein